MVCCAITSLAKKLSKSSIVSSLVVDEEPDFWRGSPLNNQVFVCNRLCNASDGNLTHKRLVSGCAGSLSCSDRHQRRLAYDFAQAVLGAIGRVGSSCTVAEVSAE